MANIRLKVPQCDGKGLATAQLGEKWNPRCGSALWLSWDGIRRCPHGSWLLQQVGMTQHSLV